MTINLFLPSTKVSTISKIYAPFTSSFLFSHLLSVEHLATLIKQANKKNIFFLNCSYFFSLKLQSCEVLEKKKSCEVSCFTLPKATAESWQGLCKLLEYPGVSTSQHPLLILWELLLGNCWPIQTHNCIHPSSMSPSNEAILVYNWHGLSSFSHPLLLYSF